MDGLRSKSPLPLLPPEPSPRPREAVFSMPPFPREKPARRGFRWAWPVCLLLFLLFLAASLFLFKLALTTERIQIKNTGAFSVLSQFGNLAYELGSGDFGALKKTEEGRINILLLGRAGEKYPGRNLTDTIMLMSIDMEKRKVALLSLPRDLFVTLPEAGLSGKINSFYQYGLSNGDGPETIRAAVETVTGQPIHYSFILDFDGFEKVIDALGGIEVDVVKDFYDTRYPGKNYSYETFELKKGWQHLDGATALKYVRERHDDPEGDFGRAKRQQQVITATREKAFSTEVFLRFDRVNKLFEALGESVETDATLPELENLFALSKKIDTRNIETYVVDAWKKESLLRVSHTELGGVRAFILLPRIGNWNEIREKSETLFSQEALRQREASLLGEEAHVAILARPEDMRAAQELSLRTEEILHQKARLEAISDRSALEGWPEESIIVDRTGLGKPWSLDTLLKRFELSRKDSHPLLRFSEEGNRSDFLVILGSKLAEKIPEESFRTESEEDTLDAHSAEPFIVRQ